MIKFETDQTIARSADDIWAYAADILRHPDWMSVTNSTILRGQGSELGDRGRERLGFGPFHWDVEFEITEALPGRRIVWRTLAGGPGDIEVALDLDPVGPTSTRATYSAAIQPRGRWRLLTPVVAMEGKAGPERELRRLKENLETVTAMVGATA